MEDSNCEGACWIKSFLFGSIKRKLWFSFGILIMLLIVIIIITYNLNKQIAEDENYLREINIPLSLMVEKVIGYDAMLTGATYASLLHAEKGETEEVLEHKVYYDEIGFELDDLLKIQARALINQSRRTESDKNNVYLILDKLNKINLKLVDLEIAAFDAIGKKDFEKARKLIVNEQYSQYKKELADLYNQWNNEEENIAEAYRQRILNNSKDVKIYNLWLGLLFIFVAGIVPFFIGRSITNPIKKLKEATEEIEKQNFKVRVDIKTRDELEQLGNSFNRTTEVLENLEKEKNQIDKAKTEFLSITSHELRSPMTPMKAQLQMVLGDYFGKLNKSQRESLQIVLNNTERLDKIIVDFLEISRIEAARLKFNFVQADLSKTIASVVEEMKGFMPEKKIKIETKIEKLPIIEVDPDRVSQVLRNLINNAIKFTPENGAIEVSAKMHSGMILFSVKDNGIGMAEKEQRRLFEPFYQVDNMYQHKSGGTGLGLAISKGIVESQNGKIWLNSAPGKGTIFYFTIPLKPVREIKAIKLLFSDSAKVDEAIKLLFREYIGPLGDKEFENLRDSRGITPEAINEYISNLINAGIIKKLNGEEFKNKVSSIIKGDKKEAKPDEVNPEDSFIKAFKKE